jgi:tellurite resistance protein
MKPSKSAQKLSEVIHKALEDHELSNSEFEEIMQIAHEDGIIDPEERALLSQLQEMIADKSIRRVGR